MRPTLRLLAAVKPTHLTPNAPTGLTGLRNHPYPRYALVDLYSRTLAALQTLPDTSVYRQSCEALTKHRLSIVESVKPLGYDEWATATKKRVEQSVQTDLQNFKQQLNVLDDFEQEQAKAGISATEADDLRERNRQILRNKLQFIEKKAEEAIERKFEVLKSREVKTSITPPSGEKPPPEKREEWMDGGFDTEASMQRKLRASMQAVLSTDEGDNDEEVPEWWQPSPTLDTEQYVKRFIRIVSVGIMIKLTCVHKGFPRSKTRLAPGSSRK